MDCFFEIIKVSFELCHMLLLLCVFGINDYIFEEQDEKLMLVEEVIKNMKVEGKRHCCHSKTEYLFGFFSLKGLLKDQRKLGLKYIMTITGYHKMLWKNLFGQIRGIKQFYDHLSPT